MDDCDNVAFTKWLSESEGHEEGSEGIAIIDSINQATWAPVRSVKLEMEWTDYRLGDLWCV